MLEGAGVVVTSRGDVHYVVTEHGIANLWGKNIRQRALALIEIAHPDFHAELMASAKARKYILMDQRTPRPRYPWEEESNEELRDGQTVHVRPPRLTDEEPLKDLFYRLSDDSTYQRFLGFKRYHPHDEMQKLVDLDYTDNMAFVAESIGNQPQILGMARFDVIRPRTSPTSPSSCATSGTARASGQSSCAAWPRSRAPVVWLDSRPTY